MEGGKFPLEPGHTNFYYGPENVLRGIWPFDE